METSRDENPLENDTEWIGPTKCDERRTSREKDIENVWTIIKPSIEKLADNKKIILLGLGIKPTDLFREATSCYQNGAFLATCAMCRISLESLFYVIISSKITSDSSAESKQDYIHSTRSEFLRKVVSDSLLDEEDIDIVKKIWDKGDFVAHYSQKLDKINFEQQGKNFEPKYWIEKNEALNIINKTASIISKVFTRWSSQDGVL